jgi:hypothetical protein
MSESKKCVYYILSVTGIERSDTTEEKGCALLRQDSISQINGVLQQLQKFSACPSEIQNIYLMS